jgi:hypothetical protein
MVEREEVVVHIAILPWLPSCCVYPSSSSICLWLLLEFVVELIVELWQTSVRTSRKAGTKVSLHAIAVVVVIADAEQEAHFRE